MHLTICAGVLTVEFTRFRLAEASWLRQIAQDLQLSGLVVDFRHGAELPDAALGALAELLKQLRSARVELRGMTARQARLLEQLLGSSSGEPDPARWPDPRTTQPAEEPRSGS